MAEQAENTNRKKLISAVEIMRKFKLSYQTVNYYTNLGLLKSCRYKGNKRLYNLKETERILRKIREYKNKGFSLRVIRDELL